MHWLSGMSSFRRVMLVAMAMEMECGRAVFSISADPVTLNILDDTASSLSGFDQSFDFSRNRTECVNTYAVVLLCL